MLRRFQILLILSALLLNINIGYSIGISPSREVIDFDNGSVGSGVIYVINNEPVDIQFETYVKGDLSEYIALTKKEGIVKAGSVEEFRYNINIPVLKLSPGIHDNRIGVVERINKDAMIGARVGVEAQIWIKVPYPGVYADADIIINSIKPNESFNMEVLVKNLGLENLTSVWCESRIIDAGGIAVASADSKEYSVEVGSELIIPILGYEGIPSGSYTIEVIVHYNNDFRIFKEEFKVGEKRILLQKYPERIEGGAIRKVGITLENMWNEPIKDVEVETILFIGDQIITTKSENFMIEAWSTKSIPIYIDATNVHPGVYNGEIKISYLGKVETINVSFIIIKVKGFLERLFPAIIIQLILVALCIVLASSLILIISSRIRRVKPKARKGKRK